MNRANQASLNILFIYQKDGFYVKIRSCENSSDFANLISKKTIIQPTE